MTPVPTPPPGDPHDGPTPLDRPGGAAHCDATAPRTTDRPHRRPGRRRRAVAVAGLLAAALTLTACGGSDLRDQARAGDDKSYVAGDGSVTELAPADRGAPIEFTGTTAEGDAVDVTDWRGDVVVLNVWYAACGPCRAEARDLESVAAGTAADGVRFLGINTRDDAPTAQAFQRRFEVTYPSVLDIDGSVIVALRGEVSPQAVPTTLVVDRQGRVAARVLGLADPSVLRTLVAGAVAEA